MSANTLSAASGGSAYLKQGEFLLSPNGGLQFIMQQDGNAVLYRGRFSDLPAQPLWSMGKAGAYGPYVLALDSSGTLSIYAGEAHSHAALPLRTVDAAGDATLGCFLSLQDDENLVMYQGAPDAPGEAIWSSRFGETKHDFTILLLQGRQIVARQAVRARNEGELQPQAAAMLREHNAQAASALIADSVMIRRDSGE